MAFDNLTNHGRVAKICEIIDLINKSAQSNNASQAEIAAMLLPVTSQLPKPVDLPQKAPEQPSVGGKWGVTATIWANVHDMALNAPLKDFTVAMAVYMSRIDEVLS